MRLVIATEQLDRLASELRRAGRREIGGVLVGRHFGGDDFALVDLSVQRCGGGRAHFQRDPVAAAVFVEDAITRTGGEARQVNYLGEWHSHPSFSASPSLKDVMQMQAIVDDPDEPATFAVLLIVSSRRGELEMSVTLFTGSGQSTPVDVDIVGVRSGTSWSIATGDESSDDGVWSDLTPLVSGEQAERRRRRVDATRRRCWCRWLNGVW